MLLNHFFLETVQVLVQKWGKQWNQPIAGNEAGTKFEQILQEVFPKPG